MPIYPMATVIQSGNTLLISSLSFAGGRRPNGWFRHLDVSTSDGELAGAVKGALARSRVEEFKDLPKPSSKDLTLEAEEMGFESWRAKEASTTIVGLTLVDGQVMVAPFQTVAGQGHSERSELLPARDPEEIAARVREGLAESARLSVGVVDHAKIAAQQSAGGSVGDGAGEDPAARARAGEVADLAQAVLTRHGGAWVLESLSSVKGDPWVVSNGWVQVVPVGEPAILAGALVEALARWNQTVDDVEGDDGSVVVDVLGVSSREALTGGGTVRISVMASTSTGELNLFPQEVDEESGWWTTPEHPETRSVGIADPLALWGTTIEVMAEDLAMSAADQ